MFCYLTMSATTFTFLLVWEHSHYVLFIQGLCLFLLDSFDLVPPRKVRWKHVNKCETWKLNSVTFLVIMSSASINVWLFDCVSFFSVCLCLLCGQMADIHKVYVSSLFLAYLFQFQNQTLLSSPLLSLLIGSVLARYFQVELAAPLYQTSVKFYTVLHVCVCFYLYCISAGWTLMSQ